MTCSFTFCLKPGPTLVLQVCRRYQITSTVLIVPLLDYNENTQFSVEKSHIEALNYCNMFSYFVNLIMMFT